LVVADSHQWKQDKFDLLGRLEVPLRADGATATAVRDSVIHPSVIRKSPCRKTLYKDCDSAKADGSERDCRVCASSEADGSERDCRVCASSEADGSERDCTDSEADGRARDCASNGADSSEQDFRDCEYDSKQHYRHCEPDRSENYCRGSDGWKPNEEVVV